MKIKDSIRLTLFLLGFPLILTASKKIIVEHNKYNAISILSNLDQAYDFVVHSIVELPEGKIKYKQIETYNNILVWDASIITSQVNFRDLKITDLYTGLFYTDIQEDIISVEPKITINEALKIIHNCQESKNNNTNTIESKKENIKLIIKQYPQGIKLVYFIDCFFDIYNIYNIYNKDYYSRLFYIIDANTGSVLEKWNTFPVIGDHP